MIYRPSKFKVKDAPHELTNFIPDDRGQIHRVGWHGMLSLIWQIIKANRVARKAGIKMCISFKRPLRWLK